MIKTDKKNKFSLGFTLVEVLVAVGVLAVGSLAFLPSFRGANRQKNLAQAVENAKDAIATARSRALTETGAPGSSSPFKYSGIKFVKDSIIYTLFRSASADATTCKTLAAGTDTAVLKSDGERVLPGGVQAKMPLDESPTCIFFEFGTGNSYTTKGNSSCAPCND